MSLPFCAGAGNEAVLELMEVVQAVGVRVAGRALGQVAKIEEFPGIGQTVVVQVAAIGQADDHLGQAVPVGHRIAVADQANKSGRHGRKAKPLEIGGRAAAHGAGEDGLPGGVIRGDQHVKGGGARVAGIKCDVHPRHGPRGAEVVGNPLAVSAGGPPRAEVRVQRVFREITVRAAGAGERHAAEEKVRGGAGDATDAHLIDLAGEDLVFPGGGPRVVAQRKIAVRGREIRRQRRGTDEIRRHRAGVQPGPIQREIIAGACVTVIGHRDMEPDIGGQGMGAAERNGGTEALGGLLCFHPRTNRE